MSESSPFSSASAQEIQASPDSYIPKAKHGHNTSTQHDVELNPDLALHLSQEHHHQHTHHSAHAQEGRTDEAVYSKGTTSEILTVSDADPQDHEFHRRHHPEKNGFAHGDAEGGGSIGPIQEEENNPQTHTFSRFYVYSRIFFHVFIFLLFTGYVAPQIRGIFAYSTHNWLPSTTGALAVPRFILTHRLPC
jgi:concentrative nucleoside transporter, CNT family